MLRRLLKRNAGRREWNREHRRAWVGMSEISGSGLTHFQIQCEAAITRALNDMGLQLTARELDDASFIKARIADTEWTLWIYPDAAEVISSRSTLVRLEEWDAKTPADFFAQFISRMVSGVGQQISTSV